MAAELTYAGVRRALSGAGNLHVPTPLLMGMCALAVFIGMGSVVIGTWQAREDENSALQRYADTEALLALPPADLAALEAERERGLAALALAEAQVAPPSVDPGSDEATSLLIERATSMGLVVRGVATVPEAETTLGEQDYVVSGIRMTLEGGVPAILEFLSAMQSEQPGIIPELGALNAGEDSPPMVEVTFSAYTKAAEPTATAPARGTP